MTHRYCARILVEAATPLKIGTGEAGLNIDERVATDANGLPMIPGTALAGVLRHALANEESIRDIFGFQENKEGRGSRLSISSAHFVGSAGEVIDGPVVIDYERDAFYRMFRKMAVRDHVRISHRGVAEDNGKFDSQLVFKGCRFVFDMELAGEEKDADAWARLLGLLHSPLFRLGGGTRKGFGELAIRAMEEDVYDLKKDWAGYMNRSARLTVPAGEGTQKKHSPREGLILYDVSLHPDDFFIFSAGYGDNDADTVSKREPVIVWNNGCPEFSAEKVLIPASSVKGAIAHRVAFHYNRLQECFADKISGNDSPENYIGENNEAVAALFGFAKNSDVGDEHGQKGRVLFSDIYRSEVPEKTFEHVSIDRFTGGAMDGALYNEKVNHMVHPLNFRIIVEVDAFRNNTKIREAFELTLKDLTTGMLPLGGHTMRGHGCFSGAVIKEEKGVKSELV